MATQDAKPDPRPLWRVEVRSIVYTYAWSEDDAMEATAVFTLSPQINGTSCADALPLSIERVEGGQ